MNMFFKNCRTIIIIVSQTNSRPKVTQVIIWPQSFLLERLKLQGKHLPKLMQTLANKAWIRIQFLKLRKCALSYFSKLQPRIRMGLEEALETPANSEGLVMCYFVMLKGLPLL